MKLIAGPASIDLARKISTILNLKPIELEHKMFPDGESYFRYCEQLSGEDVIIVQGTHPPQDKHIVQLCLLAMGAHDLNAKSITAVVPYLAYAKQDKMFKEWEVVSIDAILKILKSSYIDRIITVNIHSPWVISRSPVRIENLDATPLLSNYIKELMLKDAIVLSPGKKGDEMASTASKVLGLDYGVIKTKRDISTGNVEVYIEGVDVKGRDVIVLDDMISTGGTMVKSILKLKELGARSITVGCVHAVMVDEADKKIISAGADRIVATDSIPNKYASVSIAGILASHILKA